MDPQINLDGSIFHKHCAKCKDCNCQINLSNFNKSETPDLTFLLCKTHYFQRFNEVSFILFFIILRIESTFVNELLIDEFLRMKSCRAAVAIWETKNTKVNRARAFVPLHSKISVRVPQIPWAQQHRNQGLLKLFHVIFPVHNVFRLK